MAHCVDALLQIFLTLVRFHINRFLGWFVTRAVVDRVDLIAMERRQFKVDSSEFNYVSNSDHLLLIIW